MQGNQWVMYAGKRVTLPPSGVHDATPPTCHLTRSGGLTHLVDRRQVASMIFSSLACPRTTICHVALPLAVVGDGAFLK